MLRIAHVLSTPAGVGGAELLVASLAGRSHALGDAVVVLNVFQDRTMGEELALACDPVPVRARVGSGLRHALPTRRWLQSQLHEHRPDIVHAHLARAQVLVASLPKVANRALVSTHHHGDQFRREGRRVADLADRISLRRFDVAVAVSSSVEAALHGVTPRVRVIPNGWIGTPLPRRPAAVPIVLCIGRLRREKGHDLLLRAFPEIRAEVTDAQLHLVGDGPEREALMALTRRLGIADCVTFFGRTDDVWPHLASASVLVQSSRTETFGIAVLEGLAAGIPVVAADVGGLPSLLEDGRAGLLVPADSPAALAAAVTSVLRDSDLAERLTSRGRRRADDFALESTLTSYQALYEEALALARPEGNS